MSGHERRSGRGEQEDGADDLLDAPDGVEAVAEFIKTGKKPVSIDTGEKLVTDHPVPGVPSISVEEGLKLCWG